MSPSESSADRNLDESSPTTAESTALPSKSEASFPTTRRVFEDDCTRCPALTESRNCISWGTGNLGASVVVVGEAPGAGNPDADNWQGGNWTGKAYTSRHSGRRIRRMVEAVGYGDDAYYTNAVKCFPQNSEDPTDNREPTPEERANCRTHLLTELDAVDPDVVLATGKHATATVLEAEDRELDGFIDHVLEPVWCDRLDVWLVPILHPSYQDVWIGRLGYEPSEYLAAIEATLTDVIETETEIETAHRTDTAERN